MKSTSKHLARYNIKAKPTPKQRAPHNTYMYLWTASHRLQSGLANWPLKLPREWRNCGAPDHIQPYVVWMNTLCSLPHNEESTFYECLKCPNGTLSYVAHTLTGCGRNLLLYWHIAVALQLPLRGSSVLQTFSPYPKYGVLVFKRCLHAKERTHPQIHRYTDADTQIHRRTDT